MAVEEYHVLDHIVKAVQYKGTLASIREIMQWCGPIGSITIHMNFGTFSLEMNTQDGRKLVNVGDWITHGNDFAIISDADMTAQYEKVV